MDPWCVEHHGAWPDPYATSLESKVTVEQAEVATPSLSARCLS